MARILIVDDSQTLRRLLRKALEEAGHEVVGEAEDGMEGAILFSKKRPDVVTLDFNMPDFNGLTCLASIRANDPQAKVLILSSEAQAGKILEALEKGASHYLTKPFEPQDLLEAVADVLKA